MAVKKTTVKKYTSRFHLLGTDQAKFLTKEWDKNTLISLEDSRDLAPVAAGELVGSSSFKRASITPNGINSSIIYKVPYAKKLNETDSDANWKQPGELSYYVRGTKVFKAIKGVKGFLTKATTFSNPKTKNRFKKAVQNSVSKAFLKI